MSKIAIIHYQPIEYYPPTTNLLDLLAEQNARTHVFTTVNNKGRKEYSRGNIKITRFQQPGKGFVLFRYYRYLLFYLGVLLRLIRMKPGKILYYETYSSFPVYLYLKYFNRKAELFIHCHEYFTPYWYDHYGISLKPHHLREKKFLYPRAKWISQTNDDRLNFFRQDHPYLKEEQLKVLPNYPPSSWQKFNKSGKMPGEVLRCVYVGSLSLKTTYLHEFCSWVLEQEGAVTMDIYAYNILPETKEYLQKLAGTSVRFFENGIEYDKIPDTLIKYDVGLLFYKAETLNVQYCAPNKLFEYLTCGLDVWFSKEMPGCYSFITTDTYPKVISVDFNDLKNFDYRSAINRIGLQAGNHIYSSENILQPLIEELAGNQSGS